MTTREFWDWFELNNKKYLFLNDVDIDVKEKFLDEFLTELHKYCDQLYFEIGGHPMDNNVELIITAAGNTNVFNKVEELIGAAPVIKSWQFIAFKPAMGFDFSVDFYGQKFDPAEIWFLPLSSKAQPGTLGLRVYYKNFEETLKKKFIAGTYHILDAGLGEKQTALNIKHVDVGLLPEQPEKNNLIRLKELPAYINWFKTKN